MKVELKQLQRLLAQRDWSVFELTKALHCTKQTVYRRLEELAEYMVVLKRPAPRTTPGPTPKRYYLSRGAGT